MLQERSQPSDPYSLCVLTWRPLRITPDGVPWYTTHPSLPLDSPWILLDLFSLFLWLPSDHPRSMCVPNFLIHQWNCTGVQDEQFALLPNKPSIHLAWYPLRCCLSPYLSSSTSLKALVSSPPDMPVYNHVVLALTVEAAFALLHLPLPLYLPVFSLPRLVCAGPGTTICTMALHQNPICDSVTSSQGNFMDDQWSLIHLFCRYRSSNDPLLAPKMSERKRTYWCFLTLFKVSRFFPLYPVVINHAINQSSLSHEKVDNRLCTVKTKL